MEALLHVIEKSRDDLSTVNKMIADYFLKNASKAVWMTTTQLAEELLISKASITRFCQHYGFSGYNDMKIALSQQLIKYSDRSFMELESDGFKHDISGNFLNQYIAVLSDTQELLSKEKLMQAARMMFEADLIMCAGIGASDLIAQDMMQKLLRMQKRAVTYSDQDLRKVALSHFTPKDLLVAISYSGKKKETLDLAKRAHAQGIPVISFTRVGDTPLSELSEVNFQAVAFEDDYRTGAFGSRMAQLYLVDVLFYTYSLFYNEEAFARLRKTYDVVEH